MLTFQQFNESVNDVIGTTDGYGPAKSGKNAIYHKTQKELHEKEADRLSKPDNDKLKEEKLLRIRKEAAFKKEVWKKMNAKDQNNLICLRDALYNLRQYHPLDTAPLTFNTVKEQRNKLRKMIQNIEEPYYKKYRNISNILTNKKLSNLDDKTGLFSND